MFTVHLYTFYKVCKSTVFPMDCLFLIAVFILDTSPSVVISVAASSLIPNLLFILSMF